MEIFEKMGNGKCNVGRRRMRAGLSQIGIVSVGAGGRGGS